MAHTDQEYAEDLARQAVAELAVITGKGHPCSPPEDGRPVAFAAQAPASGVTLEDGPLRIAFDRNIAYLNDWFERKKRYLEPSEEIGWETNLPASSEGRMLAAASHTLRWGERDDLRRIVDTLVAIVRDRQRHDGYCLPFPEEDMESSTNAWKDERRNYDRVNLTRGMIAAALVGNPDALPVMRRFYDWLNASPYLPTLLAGPFDHGSAHNCNNGHEGHLLMHFSPLGAPEDLLAVERHFVQNFFLEASQRREARSLSHYPFHVAHSYVLLAYKAWLDHYRATGAERYLEAAQGAWQIVRDHFLHIGGSLAICEHHCGSYPPDSYYLHVDQEHHTGETCGSVFWADINHRFLQLFPDETRYADEIEQAFYNVVLANQDERGYIRYHARLQGEKEATRSINTCCEVMGSPLIASLPQYLYSLADDGVYVNLFAASTLTWEQAGQPMTLRCTTRFPFSPEVELRVETASPVGMTLRIRVPGWSAGVMRYRINGEAAGSCRPGVFLAINRVWHSGDTVTFSLPMAWHTELYRGADEDPIHPRHALMYGPILMALTGADDLDLTAATLLDRLRPDPASPLRVTISGVDNACFLPYWLLDKETFTCFPTLRAEAAI